MTWTRRLGTTGLATILASTMGLAVTSSPAQAAAPVTVPDGSTMYAGNEEELDVLANDSDADGDDLAVCRVAESSYKRVFLESYGDGTVFVYSLPSARPGTYTFTYYACDFETLTPGTVTVTIEPEPNITVKALAGRPGKIKVKNPADFKIRFLYGSFKEEEPDGVIRIARNSSVVLRVYRTKIDWIAYSRRGEYLSRGHLKGITLPPGTTPPAHGRVGDRVAKLWAGV
jgi:hypothetical protein